MNLAGQVFMSFLFQPPKALKGVNYGGLPVQPGVVQHTAVNITRGQRVITESPKDHIIWSLCCFVYSNPFCLGLAALIYAIKVSLL
uniref:Uncharacterized protein n=1 Tax=Oreochromis aureus TaxID=47969 RepID=A0A668RUI8_OREAU